jgi:hypothetical protein
MGLVWAAAIAAVAAAQHIAQTMHKRPHVQVAHQTEAQGWGSGGGGWRWQSSVQSTGEKYEIQISKFETIFKIRIFETMPRNMTHV